MATTEMSFPYGPKVGDPVVLEGKKVGTITKVTVTEDGRTYVTAEMAGWRDTAQFTSYSVIE